jgi:1-acyl-sn-glycerol-3-phosphate acyltransferase
MRRSLYTGWLVGRSLVCYTVTGILAIGTFVPTYILAMLLPQRMRFRSKLLYLSLHAAYWSVCRGFMLKIEIEGAEHIPVTPAIIVANHASSLDISILGSLVTAPHVWYALNRFFSTPILGGLLRRIAIAVDQEHPLRAARSLVRGVSLAREFQLHSLLFPEGGRYLDGEIHPFFAGFAVLARKLQSPVIPVMLYNVGKVYPPGSFIIHPHVIRVVVGEPFICNEHETDNYFTERVRSWFQQMSRIAPVDSAAVQHKA